MVHYRLNCTVSHCHRTSLLRHREMEEMGDAVSSVGKPAVKDAAQHHRSGQLQEKRYGSIPPEPCEYFGQGLLTVKDPAVRKHEVHCLHAFIPFHIRKPSIKCFRLARHHLEGTFLLIFLDPCHGRRAYWTGTVIDQCCSRLLFDCLAFHASPDALAVILLRLQHIPHEPQSAAYATALHDSFEFG